MLFVFLLLAGGGGAEGYKIRRTDCSMADTTVMVCTCGGIGDPYSIIMNKGPKPELGLAWYGTRYGHNLAEQVKQHMIDLNISSVTSLHYHNCTQHYAALRVKIDFDDFPMDSYFKRDITELREITFSNIQSVHLYINSALDWGNFTIKFENILENNDFGYGREGSVVVYGDVEFCYNPCNVSERENCNQCEPTSSLDLQFLSLERVMLDGLSLSPAARPGQHGHTSIIMRNVTSLLVSGGQYEDITTDIQVEECEAWGETVNCTDVFLLGGVRTVEQGISGLIISALAVIFVFVAVVGVIYMNGFKSSNY